MNFLRERINHFRETLPEINPSMVDGRVSKATGLIIEATAKSGTVGDVCDIILRPGVSVKSEIVGFRQNNILLMPLGDTVGVAPGSRVRLNPEPLKFLLTTAYLGAF